jgi:hypothetical protein
MRTHGDAGWEARPSYHHVLFPMALDAFDVAGVRATFFLVGTDADRLGPSGLLRAVPARGHEVGNHSYEHEPWMHLMSADRVREEIVGAEEAIVRATGAVPVGFRGPGYSWSPQVLEAVADREYLFDASTLPTFLGPLARAYYFWTAKLSPEERAARAELFGQFREGFRPLRPYRWRLPSGRMLLEIPVTTLPVVRTPFHLSYLLYLARYSERAMLVYLRTALASCRAAGVEPSFLLHPLDLLGGDAVDALRFFPGMDLPTDRKRRLFLLVLGELARRFDVVPMGEHARALLGRSPAPPARVAQAA